MGQKVNPHGLRVGVIKNWDSRWYVRDEDFADTLVSDYNLRRYLKKKLQAAGVPKIEIERDSQKVRVFIHCAKPGVIIGKGGTEIEKLRLEIESIVKKPVSVNVIEVRSPDLSAQLVAENIASQLERRISFRRAMKQCIGRTIKLGAKGIKVSCGGRLGGAEIARSEHYHEGTIPLQTLRADIDYGFYEANTTYGKIGIKVWIYKGEILNGKTARIETEQPKPPRSSDRNDRGDRRDKRSGDRRNDRPSNNARGNNRGGNRGDNRGNNRSGDNTGRKEQ